MGPSVMQGVAIATTMKEILISRQYNPSLQIKITQRRATPVTKVEIASLKPVFPVAKEDTSFIPVLKKQPALISQIPSHQLSAP